MKHQGILDLLQFVEIIAHLLLLLEVSTQSRTLVVVRAYDIQK